LIKLRKHIAFLLFGIFLFPIIFQTIHIVEHHSHAHKSDHNHSLKTVTNSYSHSEGENLFQKEKICPICEYQFSINDLPSITLFNAAAPVLLLSAYNAVATEQHYRHVFSEKTPRAPPVSVS